MNLKIVSFLICFIILFSELVVSQGLDVDVEKLQFCSKRNYEFSPVFYNNGLVFCFNEGYDQDINMSNIYFILESEMNQKGKERLFSKTLKTRFNDGPLTFTKEQDTVYYSRNIYVKNNTIGRSEKNKLGIFSARNINGKWIPIGSFKYNRNWHNVLMPSISSDGKQLFFSSDMAGGYGGLDIYYSELVDGEWQEPVNLGPKINTPKNETYPFINEFRELFFSSDGHAGFGGKDIYITKQSGNDWFKPIHLEAPINSVYNDFGLIADSLFENGYFSSDRFGSNDIFRFTTSNNKVWFSTPQLNNSFCVNFSEYELFRDIDTLSLSFEWVFENGIKLYGRSVDYCFNEAGHYVVKLNLVDKLNKNFFYHLKTLDIILEDNEQPYITSKNEAQVNELIKFDAKKSKFKKYDILDYYWILEKVQLVKG